MVQPTIQQLKEKREQIREFLKFFEKELEEIDQQIRQRKSKARLDKQFFQSAIVPMLIKAGSDGLSTREIREALEKLDYVVKPAGIRLLLSRARKRGDLAFVTSLSGRAKWKLPDEVLRN